MLLRQKQFTPLYQFITQNTTVKGQDDKGTRLTTKVAQGQTKPHISLDLQQHKCCHTTCILASWEINM